MEELSIEDRIRQGQSAVRGDTGNGDTRVSRNGQGISNRPGDLEPGASEAADDAVDAEFGDEELVEADQDDDDEDDEDEDDEGESEVDDPTAEPGKPI
jgi:hypothetical protein